MKHFIEITIEQLVEDGYILYGLKDGYPVLAHRGETLIGFEYETEMKDYEAREWLHSLKETDSLHRLSVSEALWVLTENPKYLPLGELLPEGIKFAQVPLYGDWVQDGEAFTRWTVHHHVYNPKHGVDELKRSIYDLLEGVYSGEYNSCHEKCRATCIEADFLQYIDVAGKQKTLDLVNNYTQDGWVDL